MSGTELAEVTARLEEGGRTATFVDAHSTDLSEIPDQWRGIVQSSDAEKRRLLALSLWNRDFLDLIPGYANALREKLTDVRVCALSDEGPVLIYLFEACGGTMDFWIGWDPGTFGDEEPIFWETIPPSARMFLRQVHAGFTGPDWESWGIIRPKDMTTIAEWFESPDGIPGWFDNWWPDCEPIDSRRMLYITHTEGNYHLCTSPDLAVGRALTYRDGEIDVVDFGEELDKIMHVEM